MSKLWLRSNLLRVRHFLGLGLLALLMMLSARPAGAQTLIRLPAGTYHQQFEVGPNTIIEPDGSGPVVVTGDCQRSHGFHVTGSGSTVRGITVTNTVEASVLIEDGAGDVTVSGMTLTDYDCQWSGQDPGGWGQFRGGVAAWYSGPRIVVTNNVITAGGKESADGIWFKSSDANPSGGGHVIAGNTITGGWDGIGGEEEGAVHGSFDKDFTITGNVIRDCWDDGLQVEGGGQGGLVKDNQITGCGTGIALASPQSGPLVVQHNLMANLALGLYDNLFCIKLGNDAPAGIVVFLLTNICSVGGPGDCVQQTNEASRMAVIVMRRNYWACGRYVYEITQEPSPVNADYDWMCTTDPSRFVKWAGGALYGSLPAFQAKGQEAHGQTC